MLFKTNTNKTVEGESSNQHYVPCCFHMIFINQGEKFIRFNGQISIFLLLLLNQQIPRFMCDTQKRPLRYFCSCNREISAANMLCRMVYGQKDVCVFLFYSFFLAFTDPELFKVEIIPVGWHTRVCTEQLLCTDTLGGIGHFSLTGSHCACSTASCFQQKPTELSTRYYGITGSMECCVD